VTRSYVASNVSVLINAGDGTFAPRSDYALGAQPGPVAIAEVDGNGSPDIATASATSTVSLLLNSGDGSYESRRDYARGG
jgi:hypothetical protein